VRQLVKVLSGAIENLKTHFPDGAKTIYAEVIHPYQGWIGITLLVVVGDLPLLVVQWRAIWLDVLDPLGGVAIAITLTCACWGSASATATSAFTY